MKKKRSWSFFSVLGLLIIILTAASCIAPFLYMVIMSFTQSTSLMLRWEDIHFGDFSNYRYVLTQSSFARALLNSIIVVVCACFFNCLIASMAAYGFEKKNFPGKELIFRLYLITMMIPSQVTMIPIFIIMNKMGLLNTYFSLIVLLINAFGVFLIRQFMAGVPDELLDAAQVDGCPEYRIFLQIVLPLIRPVLVSLVVFTFVSAWNDFLWPLVSTSKMEMYTLTIALSLLKTQYVANYGYIMTGATITFLFPFVLYVFLQKQFVEGIALSGIKG